MNRQDDLSGAAGSIHAAWVGRAALEKERARAAGFAGREMRCEPWMPEVAAKALWDAGWRPPACGCEPIRASVEEGQAWEDSFFGHRPLTDAEMAAFKELSEQIDVLDEVESAVDKAMRELPPDTEVAT